MTVRDNVRYPFNVFTGMGHKEKEKRVVFCPDRVNLHNVNDLSPELSGGIKRRVAIAQAKAIKTNVNKQKP